MRFALPHLLLVCACDPVSLDERRWPDFLRPVTVLISLDMEPACVEAARGGVAFWQAHVDYIEPLEAFDVGGPRLGEIAIKQGPLEWPTIGLAEVARNGANISKVTVTLAKCSDQTAAHEIGHALGLDHVSDKANLMYEADLMTGMWDVTDAQLKQVR